MRALVTTITVLVLVALSGCAETVATPPATPIFDTLIVPGQRMGAVSLGMSAPDLLKALGPPQRSTVQTGPEAVASRFSYADVGAYVSSRTEKICLVYTNAPRYSTAEGLRAGMSELEVRAKLGPPRSARRLNEENLTYRYGPPLLTIVMDPGDNNRVTSISVGPGCP